MFCFLSGVNVAEQSVTVDSWSSSHSEWSQQNQAAMSWAVPRNEAQLDSRPVTEDFDKLEGIVPSLTMLMVWERLINIIQPLDIIACCQNNQLTMQPCVTQSPQCVSNNMAVFKNTTIDNGNHSHMHMCYETHILNVTQSKFKFSRFFFKAWF